MKIFSPKVSVCMVAYNVGRYIEAAIEGVMKQQVDFPIELVIGEDCSTDNTREICDAYAAKFPDTIRVLPSDINRGIAGNSFRIWQQCRGEYIAVCDSDDVWTDPCKLKDQVKILEENPSCGAVYTDVEIISETGQTIVDTSYDHLRERYRSGKVFSHLLNGNFVNNSTGIFRRSLVAGYTVDPDRTFYTFDYLLWLHIASQSEIHFINSKTTQYRKHSGGVTSSDAKLSQNRKKFLYYLPSLLLQFDKYHPWTITKEEKVILFRKMLSVLYRTEADVKMKWKMLKLMPDYFPGIGSILNILIAKYRKSSVVSDNKKPVFIF